ncbi:MAG: beta-lactamase family protein [Chloroflexi bacterium]|nr:beta-lactamase family protein [Chloroflexota bacterium]
MLDERLTNVLRSIDAVVTEAINENGLPGVAVGVVSGDQLVFAKGYGVAKAKAAASQGEPVPDDVPVTPQTVFRIGSISKTMTAIGLMQLWEAGRFQLDDPVNDYLKGYTIQHRDPQAQPVTFRHLLTHTGGLGEFPRLSDVLRPGAGLAHDPKQPRPALNEFYAPSIAPPLRPEERWVYANHGFGTLGQLIEDISGQPFAGYMIDHLFEPLGMQHSDYLRSARVEDLLAEGYDVGRRGLQAVRYLDILPLGAGSVFSNVEDMAKYMVALLNDGGGVIKPETLAEMTRVQFSPHPRLPVMGLAFLLSDFGGQRVFGHDGGWSGFVSSMLLAPEQRYGVIVFTNITRLTPNALATEIMARLLDVPNPHKHPADDALPATPHLWNELVGTYGPGPELNTAFRPLLAGAELEVYIHKNRLMVRALFGPLSSGQVLQRTDPDDPLIFRVKALGTVRLIFVRDADGHTSHIQTDIPGATYFKRPLTRTIRFGLQAAAGSVAVLAALGTVAALRWRARRG